MGKVNHHEYNFDVGKIATLEFLEIKLSLNNGFDVILFVQDVTSGILLQYSDYTVANFGN